MNEAKLVNKGRLRDHEHGTRYSTGQEKDNLDIPLLLLPPGFLK